MELQSAEDRAEMRRKWRAANPAAVQQSLERARRHLAALMANYKPCPACSKEQAGPIHRTSRALWSLYQERAQRNGGTDPVSRETLPSIERHLAQIAAAA